MRNTLPISSFPLQLLLVFETYYQPLFSLFLFFVLLFKTFNLPYSAGMMAQEGIIQGIFLVFMMIRIHSGKTANKTENSGKMTVFILLTIVALIFIIYFIVIQYYVLLIELICSIVILICDALEILFGFVSCWQFQSYEKQQ